MTQQEPCVGEVERLARDRPGGLSSNELGAHPFALHRFPGQLERLCIGVDSDRAPTWARDPCHRDCHLAVAAAHVDAGPAGR